MSRARQVFWSSQAHSLWETNRNAVRTAVNVRLSLKLCKNDICSHSNIPKAIELNFLLKHVLYSSQWLMGEEMLLPTESFGSLTIVFIRSRMFPRCVWFQTDSHSRVLPLCSFFCLKLWPSSHPPSPCSTCIHFCIAPTHIDDYCTNHQNWVTSSLNIWVCLDSYSPLESTTMKSMH